MNILLNGQAETLKRGILGYLVLSAKKLPEFPLLRPTQERSHHIPGSSNGIFICSASEQNQLFNPSRSIVYNALSPIGYPDIESLEEIRLGLQDLPLNQDTDTSFQNEFKAQVFSKLSPHSCLVLESSEPLGLSVLMAKDIQLYLYGVFNADQSLFVFTNLENYDAVVQREYGDKHWVFRFGQHHDTFAVLFTKRICSRWYRWSQTPQLSSPANRFAALERSLLRGIQ